MATGAWACFLRELRLAWAGGGGAALPLGFYGAAASLTPLALGPAPDFLRAAGPGVLWIALALSALLPMERMFQADLEDGTLDAYAGSGVGLEGVALAKMAAHWIATGLPLALLSPVLWIMLQGPVSAAPLVAAASAVGGVAFFGFGGVGAALAAGIRRGGLLIALVATPLYVPTMIFGAACLHAAADGEAWRAPLMLTAAAALSAAAISPLAAAAALRAALD